MFQVVIYKPCQTTSELVEFAKFDVSKLVAGCDIILDAQVNKYKNCLSSLYCVLYDYCCPTGILNKFFCCGILCCRSILFQ
jgi:hypothetical protein